MRLNPFMRAHGATAGPRLRPVATGICAGFLGFLFGLAVLISTGAQHELLRQFGAGIVIPIETSYALAAGALYGKIYRRAALDPRGGWLFGMSSGFIIWMIAFAGIGPWIYGEPLVLGRAAIGALAAHFVFGTAMGIAYPMVHSLFHRLLPKVY